MLSNAIVDMAAGSHHPFPPRPPPDPQIIPDIDEQTGLLFSLLRNHLDGEDSGPSDLDIIAALEAVMAAPHNSTVLAKAAQFANARATRLPDGASREALGRAHAVMSMVSSTIAQGGSMGLSPYTSLPQLQANGRRALLLCLESAGVGARKFDAFPTATKAPCTVFNGCTVVGVDGATVMRPASNLETCSVIVPRAHDGSSSPVPYSGSGRGYAILDKLNGAIYGDVVRAIPVAPTAADGVLQCTGDPPCAVKRLSKAAINQNRAQNASDEDALLELDALAYLTSRLRTEGSAPHREGAPAPSGIVEVEDCLEDDENLYLVMGFAGEDLFDVLSREGALSEARAKQITRQVLQALATAARFGVAHHDVSIENVLLDTTAGAHAGTERATLIDWGQCIKAPCDAANRPIPIANALRWPGSYGKANSKAPEVMRSESMPGSVDVFKADIFAVGVMLFTLLFGFPPWDLRSNPADPTVLKTYRLMTGVGLPRGRLNDILVHWGIASRVSPEAAEILQALLCSNPANRPNHTDALNFSWFL